LHKYLEQLLQLESVACKDWLTNKVDRSVTGRIAMQQCSGSVQLPLNNLGIVSIDYQGTNGIATSLGHAPAAALISPENGSVLAIAKALTNILWAPLTDGLKGVSLSANWMWPCRNDGEDARLYSAVQAASDFAIDLGINIPTGKDSLSMTQKYPGGEQVKAPGTVIITAVAEVSDCKKAIRPALNEIEGSGLYYIDFSSCEHRPGGSAFFQTLNGLGETTPTIADTAYFANAFAAVQELIVRGDILAGHDISAGGLITTLLEMCFTNNTTGMKLDLKAFDAEDIVSLLFSENPGIILQTNDGISVEKQLRDAGIHFHAIGSVTKGRNIEILHQNVQHLFDINSLRDLWFKTSYLLDRKQCGPELALMRYKNYKNQELHFDFPAHFTGTLSHYGASHSRSSASGIKAAIIREKGVNGDREMAYSIFLAGFDVKDVHMTDLISGRENLEDVNFIVFVGGFSNSDVLGSAKGWAGAFLYNPPAREALEKFYARPDTLSLGICNGCQLMIELGLITPHHEVKPKMLHNDSHKFESGFISVDVLENKSIMLQSLANSRMGIWVAHGEGKFDLPYDETAYHIPVIYTHEEYPGNPNGSEFNAAALCSADGRHLAMMPHLERAVMPWQWAYYPDIRKNDEVSPWLEAFANAKRWVEEKVKR
jgi:phosphoribosylformylglycinamidine synthase